MTMGTVTRLHHRCLVRIVPVFQWRLGWPPYLHVSNRYYIEA